MSKLGTILVLSFIVLLAAGTVVYAQAMDTPGSHMPNVSQGGSDWENEMIDYCLNGSSFTPEQRTRIEQTMRNYMENADWDEMWQWMEQNGVHMGENSPMNAENWDEMWQWMDEHMGDGNWQNHPGCGYGNSEGNGDAGSADASGSTGDTGAGSFMDGGYGPGAHMGSAYYNGDDSTAAGANTTENATAGTGYGHMMGGYSGPGNGSYGGGMMH